jgi:colanic acid biosynthesis glycosyl transferase WcaI
MKNRKLKLLVYGINYHPELSGIGKYSAEMCAWLAARGHDVEMITALPYYPAWKINKAYQGKLWHSEIIQGVKVHRCPLYVPSKVTGASRMLHEMSFMLSSSLFWFSRFFRSYDAVIAIYPPLAIGFFPVLYKMLRGKTFIMHAQDLQVDAAKELGLIKNKSLLNILEKIEKFYFKKARIVSSISEGMKNRIILKGLPVEKYFSMPNWVDTEFIKPLNYDPSYKKKLGFNPDDRIILYSGNMGEKQGLEVILNVAASFADQKNLYFVLAGEGMMKKKLMEEAGQRKLHNIRFMDLQPYEELPDFLAIAEIHLVLQKKVASDLMMPSKLSGILSAGGLAIVTAEPNTTLYNLLTEYRMAILIESENETALQGAIQKALTNSGNHELKINARKFAEKKLNINTILLPFEKLLIEMEK